MKKIWIYIILSFSLFAKEVFVVGINDAPPYRIIKGKNYSGIYIDIINEVSKEAGIELEFVELPFQRALEEMKLGKIDIMLGPTKNKEREEYMYFIEKYPFPKEAKVFYSFNKIIEINKYEDLYGKKIEVLRGAKYFEKFDNDIKLIKNPVNDYLQAFNKVKAGRSDLVIIPQLQGDYLSMDKNLKGFIKSKYQVEGSLSFVTISKKSKNYSYLKDKLTSALEKVNKNGTYDKIIAAYKY